jgi:drug/metabolite transporter (DMT)-like permease
MSSEIKGLFLAVLSAALYGTLPILGKQLTTLGLTTEAMLFWRFSAAFIMLAVCFPKLVFMIQETSKRSFTMAIIGFILSAFFYFECAEYLGTGIAMCVFFIYPMILALFNFIFLKEKLPLLQKFGMALALLALVFLSNFEFHYQGNVFIGFMFGLIGGIGYALFIFCTKSTGLQPITLTSWVCFGAACFFGLHSLWTGSMQLLPEASALFWLGLVALVGTLLPIIFLIKAITLIGNVKASLLSIIEPATTIALGMVFLGEQITWVQSIGLVCIVASLITIEGRSLFGRSLPSTKE